MSRHLFRARASAAALILSLLPLESLASQIRVITPPPAGAELFQVKASNKLGIVSKYGLPPQLLRQVVPYRTKERVGTIIVNPAEKFLYLVMPGNQAMRYGIGVAKQGFEWSGTNKVTAKREWPSWTPPKEMLQRRPDIPTFMEGGPDNPLGARALYIGSTLYRIHGTSEPWSIGQNVSSGCIRLTNEDVIDLYGRVGVGAKVIVL